MRHLLWYSFGPGLLAGLLHNTEELVMATVSKLKAMWHAWRKLQDLTSTVALQAQDTLWLNSPWVESILVVLGRSLMVDHPTSGSTWL